MYTFFYISFYRHTSRNYSVQYGYSGLTNPPTSHRFPTVLQKAGLSTDKIIEKTKSINDKRTQDAVLEYLPVLVNEDRQEAAIQIIKDRNANEFDAKKIIRAIRENPNEEPQAAVDREFSVPNLIGLQVKLTIKVNKALAHATLEHEVPKHVLAAQYIERCLKEDGHLQ